MLQRWGAHERPAEEKPDRVARSPGLGSARKRWPKHTRQLQKAKFAAPFSDSFEPRTPFITSIPRVISHAIERRSRWCGQARLSPPSQKPAFQSFPERRKAGKVTPLSHNAFRARSLKSQVLC